MAMEGLKVKSFNGDVRCARPTTSCSSRCTSRWWKKADAKPVDYSVENTGYTFAPVKTFEPYVSSTPTSCQMKRPAEAPDRRTFPPPGRITAGAFSFLASVSGTLDQFSSTLLNGSAPACCCSCSAPGLTLIFSMMGVLNFAHASFYMVGAYFAYTLTGRGGLLGRAGAGAAAGGRRRRAVRAPALLRKVHKFGHVPELLVTFGLSTCCYELVQADLGPHLGAVSPPPALQGPAFTLVQSSAAGLRFVLGVAPEAMCKGAAAWWCSARASR
jgi:hypothetical protein